MFAITIITTNQLVLCQNKINSQLTLQRSAGNNQQVTHFIRVTSIATLNYQMVTSTSTRHCSTRVKVGPRLRDTGCNVNV